MWPVLIRASFRVRSDLADHDHLSMTARDRHVVTSKVEKAQMLDQEDRIDDT